MSLNYLNRIGIGIVVLLSFVALTKQSPWWLAWAPIIVGIDFARYWRWKP